MIADVTNYPVITGKYEDLDIYCPNDASLIHAMHQRIQELEEDKRIVDWLTSHAGVSKDDEGNLWYVDPSFYVNGEPASFREACEWAMQKEE